MFLVGGSDACVPRSVEPTTNVEIPIEERWISHGFLGELDEVIISGFLIPCSLLFYVGIQVRIYSYGTQVPLPNTLDLFLTSVAKVQLQNIIILCYINSRIRGVTGFKINVLDTFEDYLLG
jgi:hypothetical protein